MREKRIEFADHPLVDALSDVFGFGAFERAEDLRLRRPVEKLIRHRPEAVVFLLNVTAEQRRVRGGLQRERGGIALLDSRKHAGDGGAGFDVLMSHHYRGSESRDAAFERGKEDLLFFVVVARVGERPEEVEQFTGGGEIDAIALSPGRGQMVEDFEGAFDQTVLGAKDVGRLRCGGVASHGNLPSARGRVGMQQGTCCADRS